MIPAAYLAADAARLADAELPRTVSVPLPAVTDTVLTELDYAVDLFQRADRAISTEVAVLSAIPLGIDWSAVQRACSTLVNAAVAMHICALQARERRPA